MKRSIFFASFSLLAVGGCASITGLGKDYDFSDDASTSAGEAGSDAPSSVDAGKDAQGRNDAGDQCGFDALHANKTTEACRTCLADHCCLQLTACVKDTICKDDQSCAFDCQTSTNRRECLNNCPNQSDLVSQAATKCISENCALNGAGPCANLFR